MEVISPFTPKDWRQLRLRDISKIGSGTTPPRSMSDKYFSLSGTSWLKTMDLNNAEITSTEEKLTDAAFEDCSIKVYEVNTIFVAMYGGFRQIGRTGIGKIPLTVNQAISAIEVCDVEVEPKYIQHWLNSRINGWRRFAASSRKDPNITRTDVLAFPIALPSRFEQIAICGMISHWSSAITICEKLLSAKKELRKGFMQQLLSGKKRLPEFVNKWQKIKLNKLIKSVHRPIAKPDSRYRVLGIRSHFKGTFEKYIDDPKTVAMEELYIAKENDLIVNITFAWEGAVAIVPKEHDGGLVSHRFPMYRVIEEKIDLDFLRYVVIQPRFKYLLGVISPGGAGRNRVLSKKDFLELEILLPEIDEQRKVGKILRTADKEIELLHQQLEAFKEQKKGLMQQLLTGKKRVKVQDVA